MQKNIITNKITPCCGLPFSVIYWWVSNLTLNSESDRQFILSKISQNGKISIDGWKVLINSGTLEADASLTKAEFLAWFNCERQPSCEQLKIIIEAFKISNWSAFYDSVEELNLAFEELENKLNLKYNNVSETDAVDIIQRVDQFTGQLVTYKEVTNWIDGTVIDDAKTDGVIYRKFGAEYYALSEFVKSGKVDVRLFGNVGTVAETTATFKRGLAFLDKIGRGILNVPIGNFVLNEPLHIQKPLIGIRGAGIGSSILKFVGTNGIVLSSYADFSFATISGLSINGNNTQSTVGISLPKANFYFLKKFAIAGFDTGIQAQTAVMNKFEDFSISSCNNGIHCFGGCYFLTIFNGNVRACVNYGIHDEGNGVKIMFTDIEAIGTYNSANGHYEIGPAVIASGGTTISNCHIETSGFGMKVGNGGVKVENTFIGGCVVGVAESIVNATGVFAFEQIKFSGIIEEHFEIPTLSRFLIKNCEYYTSQGQNVGMVATYDPKKGVVESYGWTVNGYEKTLALSQLKINTEYVFKGYKFVTSVEIGTVNANSTFQSIVELPSGITTNEWSANAIANFQSFYLPSGIILQVNPRNSSISQLVLSVINVTGAPIDLGTRGIIISIFN